MGGYGSGRKRWAERSTLDEQSVVLRIANLRGRVLAEYGKGWVTACGARESVEARPFEPVPDGAARVTVLYCAVRLEWVNCRFGGQRPWLLCPDCDRRCGVLYLDDGWTCRLCLGLPYKAQREGELARAARRKNSFLMPIFLERRRGMHHSTYLRLKERYEEAEAAADDLLEKYARRCVACAGAAGKRLRLLEQAVTGRHSDG